MYKVFHNKRNSHQFYTKYLNAAKNTILDVIYTLKVVFYFENLYPTSGMHEHISNTTYSY
jgi:hypothetical protein